MECCKGNFNIIPIERAGIGMYRINCQCGIKHPVLYAMYNQFCNVSEWKVNWKNGAPMDNDELRLVIIEKLSPV